MAPWQWTKHTAAVEAVASGYDRSIVSGAAENVDHRWMAGDGVWRQWEPRRVMEGAAAGTMVSAAVTALGAAEATGLEADAGATPVAGSVAESGTGVLTAAAVQAARSTAAAAAAVAFGAETGAGSAAGEATSGTVTNAWSGSGRKRRDSAVGWWLSALSPAHAW